MKFSLEWLKDSLDTDASVAEISAALNAIGILQRTWPRPEIWKKRKAEYLSSIGRHD